MGDRGMLAAGTFFAAATACTHAVSLRQPQLPDEPFGIRFPGRVPVHLALGLGSGVAAPWPMPVIALAAAARAGGAERWPERTCAGLGAVVLVGTLAEPASWGLRPRSSAARATVVLNLLSGVALFLAGTTGKKGSRGRPGTPWKRLLPERPTVDSLATDARHSESRWQ